MAVRPSARRGTRWDRVVACDPGLNRLRMALSSALSMSSTLALEYGFARLTNAGPQGEMVDMMLGTVLAMMGSMALSGPGWLPKLRTGVFFPVAIGAGMLAGVAVAGHTDWMLTVFVAVMFLSVYVRRFGLPFFFYGFMGWMGYFFAAFLDARLSAVPAMMYAVLVATGWSLVLSVTVLRTHPRRTLGRVRRAFFARARAVAACCADLLDAAASGEGPERVARLRRRLHARQLRLAEAALMIEGWSADPAALPAGWSGAALRRRLLDAQVAVDAMATAAEALADGERDTGAAVSAARIARLVAHQRYPEAEEAARPLLWASQRPADPRSGKWWPAQHVASAASEFAVLARSDDRRGAEADAVRAVPGWAGGPGRGGDEDVPFESAVTLVQGLLPGSAAVAGRLSARGHRWNPLSRASLTTRQAIQVAVAGALAIIAGRELSEVRYYWAVLAAFVAFAGTATRSETTIKAFNRVVGTLTGLGVAIVLAHLTAGHTMWVLVVIVVSMSCGFYLMNITYAAMIFFVTIMVSQLYSVLHEFTDGLLVLRLEETALGAAIGVLVALVVLPTSTRDTAGAAREGYFGALADLLGAAAGRLGAGGAQPPAGGDRLETLAIVLDHRLQQLALVARPLTRPLVWGNDPRHVRHRLIVYAAVTRHARALALACRWLPAASRPGALAAACAELAAAATALAGGDTPNAGDGGSGKTDGEKGTDGGSGTDKGGERQSALPHSRPAPDVARRLATAEAALLTHRPQGAGTEPARSLVHLRRLMAELAVAPDAAVVDPVPAAPRGGPAGGGLELRGTVLHGAGLPIARAAIAVTDERGRQCGRALSHDDGGFAVGVPRPGRYLLVGSADGHRPQALTVPVDEAGADVRLTLTAMNGVTGTVRDAVSGAPVADASVTLAATGAAGARDTATGPDGGYALTGLAPGPYTLTVRSPGHLPHTAAVIVPDGDARRVDVDLVPGVRFSGTVRGVAGAPVRDARITVIDADGECVASAETDHEGRFRLPGLRPGDYTVVSSGHMPASASLTLPTGGHAALDVLLDRFHPAGKPTG